MEGLEEQKSGLAGVTGFHIYCCCLAQRARVLLLHPEVRKLWGFVADVPAALLSLGLVVRKEM